MKGRTNRRGVGWRSTAVGMVLLGLFWSVPTLPGGTSRAAEPAWQDLFDGHSFTGWNGDIATADHPGGTWRIEDGEIVAGSDQAAAARNEFLATDGVWGDFELRLEYRIEGSHRLNAGVQFRSRRIPDHHEVIGYQADIGPGLDGALYDESRRRRFLAQPDAAVRARAVAAGSDGWHELTIRCEGPRVRIRLNGVETVDFTEMDAEVEPRGMIAVQIHGQMVGTIRYRNIQIAALPGGTAGEEGVRPPAEKSP